MKQKIIERTTPAKTQKSGWIATVQQVQNITVLNIYKERILKGRYCMNSDTYEFKGYDCDADKWTGQKLAGLLELPPWYYGTYKIEKRLKFNSPCRTSHCLSLIYAN